MQERVKEEAEDWRKRGGEEERGERGRGRGGKEGRKRRGKRGGQNWAQHLQ